jgi:transposase InsO family protein
MAESFFGALKNEWLNRFEFTDRVKARRQVVRYIEGFYNRQRCLSQTQGSCPENAGPLTGTNGDRLERRRRQPSG